MRYIITFLLFILCSLNLWAESKITPFDLKEGLWEVTVTHSMTGGPAVPSIPQDALENMSPEQRARIQGMMKKMPRTTVRKNCVTKEKLQKYEAFSEEKGKCTREVIKSTAKRLEIKFSCASKDSISDGTMVMDAVSSDRVKGTMHSVTKVKGKAMNMDFTFDSKYLGPSCGDVK